MKNLKEEVSDNFHTSLISIDHIAMLLQLELSHTDILADHVYWMIKDNICHTIRRATKEHYK